MSTIKFPNGSLNLYPTVENPVKGEGSPVDVGDLLPLQ